MEKVLIGMSGGVDSSAAAAILIKNGYDVTGCTLRLYDGESPNGISPDISDAVSVCEKLNINHTVVDLREEFKRDVIGYFLDEYLNGRTPNPCIVCNKKVKFGYMLNTAYSQGFEKIATGHYADITVQNGRYLISRPHDRSKDQTYMLYQLNQEQLKNTIFPLSGMTKAEVREIAEEYNLINARKKDSQDICFVPDGDYAAFIERFTNTASCCGDFTDINGKVLGKHSGIIRYTVGQRKGLGIALGKPAFVLEKDIQHNRVILDTDESLLFYRKVLVENTNFIPFDTLNSPIKVKAKLRYRHTEQSAVLHPIDQNAVLIEFEEPQRAPSAGQAAVFYDGDILVGGGTIVKGVKDDG